MTIRIDNVTVLGTGVLGSQIAYQTAYSGFEVMAYDISDEIVNTARKRFAELAARYEREVEGAGSGRAEGALARIKYSSSLVDAVRDADLVIESAPERLDVKRELLGKLAPLAPERNDLRHQQLHAAAERARRRHRAARPVPRAALYQRDLDPERR
jgi:3-hydroxyacyl-CoA dehydrogenase